MNEYKKKYKLSREQIETYEWIKDQNINTSDSTICYWVKIYEAKRIREVVNFANQRAGRGQEIRNLGGWIRNFLKSGQAVVNDNCNENLDFVKQFIDKTKWKDLRIYEKYVKDIVTEDDLSLTMEQDEFKRSLESLYRKSQLYRL